MTRPENKGPTPDDSVYLRINEVHQLHQQGLSIAAIAETMDMDEAEVARIIREPYIYQRLRGLPIKGVNRVQPLPLPSEIADIRRQRGIGLRGYLAGLGIKRYYDQKRREAFDMADCFCRRHRKYDDGVYPDFAEYSPRVYQDPKFTRRGS